MPSKEQERWLQAVRASVGTSFTFEALLQSDEVLRVVVDAFVHYLGPAQVGPAHDLNWETSRMTWQWNAKGRPVQLRVDPLGAVGAALALTNSL